MNEIAGHEVCRETSASAIAQAGKYLTFNLADELYGIDILRVREIIGLMRVTRIPGTPAHFRGVINLRGKVIPVIDLRIRFGMPTTEATQLTCVIVVDIATPSGTIACGLVADAVSDVLNIESDKIERPPSLCTGQDSAYLSGIGKSDNRVTILLDINNLFTADDLMSLASDPQIGGGTTDLN